MRSPNYSPQFAACADHVARLAAARSAHIASGAGDAAALPMFVQYIEACGAVIATINDDRERVAELARLKSRLQKSDWFATDNVECFAVLSSKIAEVSVEFDELRAKLGLAHGLRDIRAEAWGGHYSRLDGFLSGCNWSDTRQVMRVVPFVYSAANVARDWVRDPADRRIFYYEALDDLVKNAKAIFERAVDPAAMAELSGWIVRYEAELIRMGESAQ